MKLGARFAAAYPRHVHAGSVPEMKSQSGRFRSNARSRMLSTSLICVESEWRSKPAFRKVSGEIGRRSIPLAEELALTRRNCPFCRSAARLPMRTSPSAPASRASRALCLALQQAERYGTPNSTETCG